MLRIFYLGLEIQLRSPCLHSEHVTYHSTCFVHPLANSYSPSFCISSYIISSRKKSDDAVNTLVITVAGQRVHIVEALYSLQQMKKWQSSAPVPKTFCAPLSRLWPSVPLESFLVVFLRSIISSGTFTLSLLFFSKVFPATTQWLLLYF